MEFFSLLSALWQTDRWTGRLTDNVDPNVAGDTPSAYIITATCPHSHEETLISFSVLVSCEVCLPRDAKGSSRGRTRKNAGPKDVFLPLVQFAFCFLCLALTHVLCFLDQRVFKCFPVWEISVK